jgi:hypothetical protein
VDIQYCVADIIIEKLELHHFVYCILNLGKTYLFSVQISLLYLAYCTYCPVETVQADSRGVIGRNCRRLHSR